MDANSALVKEVACFAPVRELRAGAVSVLELALVGGNHYQLTRDLEFLLRLWQIHCCLSHMWIKGGQRVNRVSMATESCNRWYVKTWQKMETKSAQLEVLMKLDGEDAHKSIRRGGPHKRITIRFVGTIASLLQVLWNNKAISGRLCNQM